MPFSAFFPPTLLAYQARPCKAAPPGHHPRIRDSMGVPTTKIKIAVYIGCRTKPYGPEETTLCPDLPELAQLLTSMSFPEMSKRKGRTSTAKQQKCEDYECASGLANQKCYVNFHSLTPWRSLGCPERNKSIVGFPTTGGLPVSTLFLSKYSGKVISKLFHTARRLRVSAQF